MKKFSDYLWQNPSMIINKSVIFSSFLKKIELPIFLLFGIAFLFFFVLPYIWNLGYLVFGALSLVTSLFFYLYLLKTDYIFTIICSFFIFSSFWVACSNLYIEFGNYIPEQVRYGSACGATTTWSFLSYLCFITAFIVFQLLKKKKIRIGKIPISEFFILLTFSTFIALYISLLLIYGSPLLDGIERFEFWMNVPKLFRQINNYFPLLFLILGVIFIRLKIKFFRNFSVILLVVFLILNIFFAAKFSSLFLALFHFLVGVLVASYFQNQYKVKPLTLMKKFTFICFLFLPIILFNYMWIYDYTLNGAMLRILERGLGLQGHTWYGVYDLYQQNKIQMEPTILFKPMQSEYEPTGLVALMWEISPASLVKQMRELKISFTMGSPANFLAVYGLSGAVMSAFIGGIILSALCKLISHSISNYDYVLLLTSLIFYRVYIQVFLMGDFFKIYDFISFLSLICLLILMILPCKRTN